MKIEAQTEVKLRNGEKAWVIGKSENGQLWMCKTAEKVDYWNPNGSAHNGRHQDIVGLWVAPLKPVVFAARISPFRDIVGRQYGQLGTRTMYELLPYVDQNVEVTIRLKNE